MSKEANNNTEEAVYKEVESPKETESEVKSGISISVREDGSMNITFEGDQNHITTLQGLLDYGQRYIDNIWNKMMEANEENKEA